MKIALVAHWDWVLYHFRLPLAERLRSCGAEIYLVSPRGEYAAGLREAGFRWLEWKVERRGTNPVREMASVAQLTRLYRREGLQAVHHFTVKPVLYGSVAAGYAGVPTTINTFSGLGFLFSESEKARAWRVLIQPLLRRMLRRPSAWTIFQNPADRDRLVRSRLAPDDRAVVIPGSGVDTRRFTPAEPAPAGDAPIVLMGARLLWDKGVGEFVEAARLLRDKGVRARFLLAGRVDDGNPQAVSERSVEEWRREGVVEFLGHRDDMPVLLRQAAVVALPSYHEGVPRFLLEAAATGLPIVATDVEGCRAVVKSGGNGLLVPVRNAQALADAIGFLIADSGLRARMGHASRQIALERFDETTILDQHEALYRRLGLVA